MEIHAAQRELRRVYRGGAVGQLVSGVLWLGSAALGTWGTPRQGIMFLVIGGMFIFPVTTLGLRLLGGPTRVSAGNALHGLGAQVALVLPLTLPVVGAAAMYRLDWFYPAFMVALGAHYLPFVFLYGMRIFGLLAFGLVGLGVSMSQRSAGGWADPAWVTGAVLLLFSAAGWMATRQER